MRYLFSIFFITNFIFFSASVFSQKNWTGGGDGFDWSDPNNWNPAGVPISTDNAVIPDGAFILIDDGTFEVNNLTVNGEAALPTGIFIGIFNPNSTILNVNGNLFLNTNETSSSAIVCELELETRATLNITGDLIFRRNANRIIVNGNLNINGNIRNQVVFLNQGRIVGEGRINFNGTSLQTIRTNFPNFNLSDIEIEISNSSANGVVVGNNLPLTVRELVVNNGSIFTTNNQPLNINSGNLSNEGTFNPGSSKIRFQGANNVIFSGVSQLDSLSIEKNAGSSVTLLNPLNIIQELNVSSGTFNTSNRVVLISDEQNTSRIAPVTGTISGNVTQQRFIDLPAAQWYELASPVGGNLQQWQNSGLVFGGFPGSNFPSLTINNAYRYNVNLLTSNHQDGWGSLANDDNTNATNITNATSRGLGWKLFTPEGNYTLNNVGQPINSSATINLTFNNSNAFTQSNSWNLVGNPFCSPIDWVGINRNNAHQVYSIYSRIGANSYQYNSYDAVADLSVNGDGQRNIASGQAFWVRATGAGASLTVPQSAKVSSAAFQRDLGEENPAKYFKLFVRNQNSMLRDEVAVVFKNDANIGVDEYDSPKQWADSNTLSELAIVSENIANAFTYLPEESSENILLPIKVVIKQNNLLKFGASEFNNLNELAYCLQFFDSVEDIILPIDNDFEYIVNLDTGVYNDRFFLIAGSGFNYEISEESCLEMNNGSIFIEPLIDNAEINVFNFDNELIANISNTQNLEHLISGTYNFQISDNSPYCAGISKSITLLAGEEVKSLFSSSNNIIYLEENPIVIFENQSENYTEHYWLVEGESEPFFENNLTYTFNEPGLYEVSLIVSNGYEGCEDVYSEVIEVLNSELTNITESSQLNSGFKLLTKTQGEYIIQIDSKFPDILNISMYNVSGQIVWSANNLNSKEIILPSKLNSGLYIIEMLSEKNKFNLKVVY